MLKKCNIRLAENSDLDSLYHVYSKAREFMKNTNNPNQWKDSYPSLDIIKNDIINNNLYVITYGEEVHAAFAFIQGEDPTYQVIYDGSWMSNAPYYAIHRVASDGVCHSIFKTIVEFASSKSNHLRIDTHPDNMVMQHQILKEGFQKTGIIYTHDGTIRLAYEKLI